MIIAVVGLSLLATVLAGSTTAEDGATLMPLLALLAMCEFGFLASLAGTYLGAQGIRETPNAVLFSVTATCAALMVLFALQGLKLWPG